MSYFLICTWCKLNFMFHLLTWTSTFDIKIMRKKNYPDSSVHKIVVFRPFRLLSIKKVIWSEWLDGQRATATFINHSLVREARVNMARSHGWIDTLKQKEKNTIFCASLRVSAWTNQPKKKKYLYMREPKSWCEARDHLTLKLNLSAQVDTILRKDDP